MYKIILFPHLFIVIILFLSIPVGLCILFYKIFKNKINKKIIFIIISIFTIIIFYLTYTAFYPSDGFYEDEFEEITGLNFPNTGVFIHKTATFPSHHGDYCSVAAIEVNKYEFEEYLRKVKLSSRLTDTLIMSNKEYYSITNNINNLKYLYFASTMVYDNYYFIGFCDDYKTIIIHILIN